MQIKSTFTPSSVFSPSGVLITAKAERIVSVIAFLFGSFLGFVFFFVGLFDRSISVWELVGAFLSAIVCLGAAYGMARSKRWGFYMGAGCLLILPVMATIHASDYSRPTLFTNFMWLIIWAAAFVRLANRLASIPTPTETLIDQIAKYHQLDWSSHVLNQLDDLVRGGKTTEAVRLFHSEAGVTWDEATAAIGNWSANAIERKLFFLAKHVKEHAEPERSVSEFNVVS